MATISCVTANQLEALCKVLGATVGGLSGSEIGQILKQMQFTDTDPGLTKWKRLYNSLALRQNRDRHGVAIFQFIEAALDPVRYSGRSALFDEMRDSLNEVLLLIGYLLGPDGKLRTTSAAKTLSEAEDKANRLRAELRRRNVHADVLQVCQARLLRKDYFYAVLEAAKSVAVKTRKLSGLEADGVALVSQSLDLPKNGHPVLAFNSLRNDSEINEHKGVVSLMKGVFAAFRNPLAHEPEASWPVSEQDALDVLTLVSLIHRRLDQCVLTTKKATQNEGSI